VKVWDAKTGQEKLALKGHAHTVNSVAFSRDGTRIASASHDKTVKVWDAKTGMQLLSLKGHAERVNSVSFNHDGTRIASGSDDKTVKVWDAKREQEVLTLKGHAGAVYSVAFSPDGTHIISGDGPSDPGKLAEVKVWYAGTGKKALSRNGLTDKALVLALNSEDAGFASNNCQTSGRNWISGRCRNRSLFITHLSPLPPLLRFTPTRGRR
jgi:WD40 repeat protein